MTSSFDTTTERISNHPSGRGTEPKRPSRSVGRAATLPTGRAAIGALLVVFAGVGMYVASVRATSTSKSEFIVAARDLNEGHQLTEGDLGTVVGETNTALSANSFSEKTPLVGAVVLGPISAGELIQGSIVQRGGLSLREMSFPVPLAHALNGALDSGDRIDIVAVTSADEPASTVLAGLRVTKVSGGGLDVEVSDTLVITVSLSNSADQVALAAALGGDKLFVVRANDTGSSADSTEAGKLTPAIPDSNGAKT